MESVHERQACSGIKGSLTCKWCREDSGTNGEGFPQDVKTMTGGRQTGCGLGGRVQPYDTDVLTAKMD